MYTKTILFNCLLVVASLQSFAQSLPTAEERMALLKGIKEQLQTNYYFQETVPATIQRLDAAEKAGRYNNAPTLDRLFKTIEEDIYATTKDKHIRITYQKPVVNTTTTKKEAVPMYLKNPSYLNEGLPAVEVLPGNIGYLKLTSFGDFETDKSLMAAVFSFVKNTDALIIDLRKNGGGTYSRLVSSYLLPETSIHLITYKWKDGNIDSIYTFKKLDGPRYLNRPVYILTSDVTFSSAEEFVYDLKHLNRVTVVGDTTKGGANPGRPIPFYQFKDGATLSLFIPFGHVINTVTQSNWEGVGVVPDKPTESEQALLISHLELINQKITKSTSKEEQRLLKWIADDIKANLSPLVLNSAQAGQLTGDFGEYKIVAKGTKLFMERKSDQNQYELISIEPNFFLSKELANTRYRIDHIDNKRQLTVLYRNGREEHFSL